MAHRSHVPKFGNWDGDEEQYTAYFETARREKDTAYNVNSMTMVNPNDPEQNPQAFNFSTGGTTTVGGGGDGSVSRHSNGSLGRSSRRRNLSNHSQKSRESYGSFTPESVSSRSNYSDHNVLQRRENKRSISKGGSVGRTGSFSSSSHHRPGNGSHSSRDDENQKGSEAIPKFGEWDEKDPKSGESFTVIFSKLKQEKQTESGHLPDAPSQLPHFSNVSHQRSRHPPKSPKPKFCCFFK